MDIKYTEKGDSLTANIYLKPLKKFGIAFDFDATTSNLKPFGLLGKSSFIGRNLFKGSEIVDLSFQGSFLNVTNDPSNSDNFFNAYEFIASASVKIPRIVFPLNTSSLIPKYMIPRTNFDTSVSFQTGRPAAFVFKLTLVLLRYRAVDCKIATIIVSRRH